MSVNEPRRLALYNRLGEVIGQENADTLMSSLPLQHGVELATKRDITQLRAEIREIHQAIHTQSRLIIGAMTALAGIFSLIVGLIT